ncbi:MAG: hypothetical protein MUD10_04780 [Candidatus Pacebacteria bacterium]|jgi:hypothetical protein|nr:hypothetical protein [Candidatus Paceibacterota bacterium]
MQKSLIVATGICIFSLFVALGLFFAQKDLETRRFAPSKKSANTVADQLAKTGKLETVPPVAAPSGEYEEYSLIQQYEAPRTPAGTDGIPAEFHAVELVENSLPGSAEFWTQAYCPGDGAAFEYHVPEGYRVESCDYGEIGSHNGCSYCTMAKIKLAQGANTTPSEQGVCGEASEQNYDYEPSVDLCALGSAGGVGCYDDKSDGCKWCWSCGAGTGKVTCCEKGRK